MRDFWITLGLTAVATLVLATLARRLGWGDAATGPEAARKLQRSPVPAVGGLAILIALAVARPLDHEPHAVYWLVLWLAFLVGAIDDWRPLRPATKLVLQFLALAPAAWAVREWTEGPGAPFVVLASGLAAMNITNTFDNADGAVGAVALVGLAFVQPVAAAALLGFLVLNLDAGSPWRRGSGVPTAYLGDSGSYVVGLLVLFWGSGSHGQGWPALWIPFLDLVRLSVVRLRAGSRPWIGDRRHLAHRLQARGIGTLGVAGILAGLTLPGCLGFYLGDLHAPLRPLVPLLGLLLGGAIYGFAVRMTPASQ